MSQNDKKWQEDLFIEIKVENTWLSIVLIGFTFLFNVLGLIRLQIFFHTKLYSRFFTTYLKNKVRKMVYINNPRKKNVAFCIRYYYT